MSTLDEAATEKFAPFEKSLWYRSMRQFWHPVAYSRDVGDGPIRVELLDEAIVLVRLEGEIRAFADLCRHKGSALSLGWVEDGCLTCPYHGWAYDRDGRVVRVPARPELSGSINAVLERYHVTESAGIIWVCLSEEGPRFPAPGVPEYEDPGFTWLAPDHYDWVTSAPRRLENFVDFSHFAFVHENILGTRDRPEVEAVETRRDGHVLGFERTVVEPNEGRMKELLGLDDPTVEVTNIYRLSMPLSIYLQRRFSNGKRYILFMAASPVRPKATRSFWLLGRDFAPGSDADRYLVDFEDRVLAQDRVVVESQRPELIPDKLSAEMYVKAADQVTLDYRVWLLELAREHAAGDLRAPS